jgi:MoxR-like ATPase
VTRPIVILTSNRTRELHDALKRRCLYHWIGYPSQERETEIVTSRLKNVSETIATKVVQAVNRLREMELAKPPGVAETIDWVESIRIIGANEFTASVAEDTLGAVLKDREDLELVRENITSLVNE